MPADRRRSGVSHAVLVATSVHRDESLPDLPAAANSVLGMRAALTDPALCGWPAGEVTVLHNEGDSRVVAQRIRQVARETTGVLLLYFVGHGMLTAEGELCLALADTTAADPDLTGLEYSRIRTALRDSPAAVKIAVLDCCYAGSVIQTETLSAGLSAGLIADQSDVRGVYTLTASDLAAHVVPFGEQVDACTSFTGELLRLIRGGLPGEPDPLTLGVLYGHLRHRLRARGLPDPNQRGTDNAHDFPFTRNAARTGARTPPSRELPIVQAGQGRTFAPSRGLGWMWWLVSLLPLALAGAFIWLIAGSLKAPGLLLAILTVIGIVGCAYSLGLFVNMVQRGNQRMRRRLARLLIVNTAGIEVRVRDQRWHYRWADVSRIAERRRNFRRYICIDLKPTIMLPSAQRNGDFSPRYDPGRGEVLFTTLSGYRARPEEIVREIAQCAGPKWVQD
ncbi:hypothetical protein [Nonomuraea sp. NPDC049725]|uniref:caspase family protein n=1 Tax=Nonomuraea sp. NPDC049725 TaxID=3154508 RepID=UPI003437E3F0